jgi:hypothetical protein
MASLAPIISGPFEAREMAVATEKKITPNLPSASMYFLSHFYSENIKKKKNYKSNSMINFIYHLMQTSTPMLALQNL